MPLGFVITGVPALLIILALLAIFVLGVRSVFKATARGAKRVLHSGDRNDE
jgi:hypothetical protein